MTNPILMVAASVNVHKGHNIGLQALLLGILKSLPPEQRKEALAAYDFEVAEIRKELKRSGLEPEVSQGFETFVQGLEGRRIEADLG